MKLNDVILIIWDDPQNFHLPDTNRQLGGGKLYKDVKQFQSIEDFVKILEALDDDDLVIICCHINYINFSGYFDFKNVALKDSYNIPNIVFLSSGDSGTIMKDLFDKHKISEKVHLYSELINQIKGDDITAIKKNEILKTTKAIINDTPKDCSKYPQIDFAVITALYEDEFEEVKQLFNIKDEDIIRTAKKEYHVGYLKSDITKKVVFAIPTATGMVDSAIIATQMLELFRPKYLMMSGVCGGKPNLNFGDIVIAKSIFTFQKGKVSDVIGEDGKKIDLFDKEGHVVNYNQLYDKDGVQIKISIEKFEPEHDTIIEINSLIKDKITRNKDNIKEAINNSLRAFDKEINIYLEPIACSTMVINKEGYFVDNIKSIDRKTAAVEMESYGVARACMFANDGKTVPIIFKSVMDNMSAKDDKAKRFAAYTSAQFLKYLFDFKVIE